MKKLFLSTLIATASAAPALTEPLEFKVLGQPAAIGNILKELEQPFFENFAERTGLDVTAEFSPIDATAITDQEGLRIVKADLFDIVSLRFSPISRDAPIVLGLDLVGQNPSYAAAAESVGLFLPEVAKVFAEQFDTKLLDVWPFGPQILFCKPEFSGLDDLTGKKVRVFDQSLADFVASLGGAPVLMPFPEVRQALQREEVDCAITGPSSANSAGWPEFATSYMPLGFNIAFNGYGMNLARWNALSPDQQEAIQAAFDTLTSEIWARSEELYEEALRCNSGRGSCDRLRSYDLTAVEPDDRDLSAMNAALRLISYPSWQPICDDATEGCSDLWIKTVGAARGF